MLALSLDDVNFNKYLHQPVSKFTIDLSNANVDELLCEYARFKRMSNPNYSNSSVVYQIKMLERDYNTTLLPTQITDIFWSMWFARLVNLGLAPSSIKNYFDQTRAALTWGTRHNLRVSPTYDKYDVDKYTKIHPALTQDEVSLIAHFNIRGILQLDEKPYHQKTLNWVDKYCEEADKKWKDRIDIAINKIRNCKNFSSKVKVIKDKYSKKFISKKKREELYNKKFQGFIASARANRNKLIDTLERVRDQFIIQCNLGQRYSDIVRLCPTDFSQDKNTYKIIQQKTGNKAVVNIYKMCFDKRVIYKLLEKYKYTAPYPHSINNFNHYLHILLELIGGQFKDTINSENKIRGEIVIESIPKWKAIASHTARRSFATLNIQRGLSEVIVRHATGHSDSRSFQRYIIFDDETL